MIVFNNYTFQLENLKIYLSFKLAVYVNNGLKSWSVLAKIIFSSFLPPLPLPTDHSLFLFWHTSSGNVQKQLETDWHRLWRQVDLVLWYCSSYSTFQSLIPGNGNILSILWNVAKAKRGVESLEPSVWQTDCTSKVSTFQVPLGSGMGMFTENPVSQISLIITISYGIG